MKPGKTINETSRCVRPERVNKQPKSTLANNCDDSHFFLQMFKSKFSGWDEVIAVDFTRTAESVQKTGADLTKWARQQETKVC